MPIEFRCGQCGKLLRTGDGTAGRQAQCPECGALTSVPATGAETGSLPPPGTPFGGAGPQTPRSEDSANPYRSPQPFAPVEPTRIPGVITPSLLDVDDVFRRTWSIFKEEWGMCLAAVVLVFAVRFAFNFIVSFGLGVLEFQAHDKTVQVFFTVVRALTTQVFSIWIGIGQALFFLKIARGERPRMSEIFSGGPYFLPVLFASILFGLICSLGFLLLIVPCVIFALMFSQYYYLILDRRMGVMESLETSKLLMEGNKVTLLAIGLLSMLLGIAALIPCGLGLLVAVPYFALMYPVVYLTVSGQPTADASTARY